MAGRSKSRWTRAEIDAARAFGTERIPNNGFGQPDFVVPAQGDNPQIACQVKTKATLPAWFGDAVAQSVIDAEYLDNGAVPAVVIVHAPGQGIKKQRYMVMRFEDAVTLLTGVRKKGTPMAETITCVCPECNTRQEIFLFNDPEGLQECVACGITMSEAEWPNYEVYPADPEVAP